VIFQSLESARVAFSKGQRNAAKLAQIVQSLLDAEPAAATDYVAVVDAESLEPIEAVKDSPALIAVAARFGKVRLIDNVLLEPGQ
jgi:pantoate--beta-alanine ligase